MDHWLLEGMYGMYGLCKMCREAYLRFGEVWMGLCRSVTELVFLGLRRSAERRGSAERRPFCRKSLRRSAWRPLSGGPYAEDLCVGPLSGAQADCVKFCFSKLCFVVSFEP